MASETKQAANRVSRRIIPPDGLAGVAYSTRGRGKALRSRLTARIDRRACCGAGTRNAYDAVTFPAAFSFPDVRLQELAELCEQEAAAVIVHQAVIIAFDADEFDLLVRPLECIVHDLALLDRHS